MSLEGLRMMVTGGGHGIGRAVVGAYLDAGAHVVVVERSPDVADALRREAEGRPLTVVAGDALDPAVLQQAVDATGDHLDNLTCCVGVFDQHLTLRDTDLATLGRVAEDVWRLNVWSVLAAVKVALPALESAEGSTSSVTLTVSESAFHPLGGGVIYGSSKWALRGVVAHLSTNLAPTVRVNGVAPGGTTGTKFSGPASLATSVPADQVEGRDERIAAGTLLGFATTPEDHAGAYCYLADPDLARAVTGIVINSDGGRRY